MSSSYKKVFNNIQVLRAVAALLVVFVHLDGPFKNVDFVPYIEGWGGVDMFFVISGFVITYAKQNSSISAGHFMADRIIRIAPLYWLCTLAVFAIAIAIPSLLQATTADPMHLLKSIFFIPFVKKNGLVVPTLFVGWALNYEMFFYLLFSLALLCPHRRAGITGAAVVLATLTGLGTILGPHNVVLTFYTQPFLLEFAVGMMFALLIDKTPSHAKDTAKVGLIVAVLLAFFALLLAPKIYSEAPLLLTRSLPATIIVLGAVLLERWGVTIRNALLLTLGNASYSIYLTHPFVTRSFHLIGDKLRLGTEMMYPLTVLTIITVGIVGVIVYYGFEQPLNSRMRLVFKKLFPDAQH